MKLHHIAIWTFRLEELKEFYVRFFGLFLLLKHLFVLYTYLLMKQVYNN